MLNDRRHVTEKLEDIDGKAFDNGFGYDLDYSQIREGTEPTGRFSNATQTADHRFSNIYSEFHPSTQLQSPVRTDIFEQSQFRPRTTIQTPKKQNEKNYEIVIDELMNNDNPFQMADDCEEELLEKTTTTL